MEQPSTVARYIQRFREAAPISPGRRRRERLGLEGDFWWTRPASDGISSDRSRKPTSCDLSYTSVAHSDTASLEEEMGPDSSVKTSENASTSFDAGGTLSTEEPGVTAKQEANIDSHQELDQTFSENARNAVDSAYAAGGPGVTSCPQSPLSSDPPEPPPIDDGNDTWSSLGNFPPQSQMQEQVHSKARDFTARNAILFRDTVAAGERQSDPLDNLDVRASALLERCRYLLADSPIDLQQEATPLAANLASLKEPTGLRGCSPEVCVFEKYRHDEIDSASLRRRTKNDRAYCGNGEGDVLARASFALQEQLHPPERSIKEALEDTWQASHHICWDRIEEYDEVPAHDLGAISQSLLLDGGLQSVCEHGKNESAEVLLARGIKSSNTDRRRERLLDPLRMAPVLFGRSSPAGLISESKEAIHPSASSPRKARDSRCPCNIMDGPALEAIACEHVRLAASGDSLREAPSPRAHASSRLSIMKLNDRGDMSSNACDRTWRQQVFAEASVEGFLGDPVVAALLQRACRIEAELHHRRSRIS